ncbi:thymidylate synthase [Vibrio phage VpJYP1]|nr:thymidylate synthase [Vibrio phage VpJYP1]
MTIEVLDYHGSDNAIANAARVSFAGHGDWNSIPETYSEEKRDKLIIYLAKHRHLTPFRHTSVTIRCKEPIFLARQLGKHQAGLSWNEVSRRYVKGDVEFHIPKEWRSAPDGSIKQGSGGVFTGKLQSVVGRPYYGEYLADEDCTAHELYEDLVDVALETYNRMINAGIAPEQARMVLPQSMLTEWVWTGNLLAMAHIYRERIASGAQLEAQYFARKLDDALQPLFPVAWAALTKPNAIK